jgi:predicted transcriptional regulator YheO
MSFTDDGTTMKCGTGFMCDHAGNPHACACANVNLAPALLCECVPRHLGSARQEPGVTDSFCPYLLETIETVIATVAYEAGKPLFVMSKDDRLKVVYPLEKRGFSQLRHSVPLVAKRRRVPSKII